MKLSGAKIAVLIESDYYEPEIAYYQHRFAEEGAELHLLSRLWGQPSLTFFGHEYKAPLQCTESFEAISDEGLHAFSAVIVPSGMVSDRLRSTSTHGTGCAFATALAANLAQGRQLQYAIVLAKAYVTWSAGLGYRTPGWEVRLDGRNLNDQRAPVSVSELGDGQVYLLPAIRADLTLSWKF